MLPSSRNLVSDVILKESFKFCCTSQSRQGGLMPCFLRTRCGLLQIVVAAKPRESMLVRKFTGTYSAGAASRFKPFLCSTSQGTAHVLLVMSIPRDALRFVAYHGQCQGTLRLTEQRRSAHSPRDLWFCCRSLAVPSFEACAKPLRMRFCCTS